MIAMVPAEKIPDLWNTIKFVAISVERLAEDNRSQYLNKLLAMLLNGKAQCFVRYDEGKQLLAMMLTNFKFNEVTGEKSLFLGCLYSFKHVQTAEWASDLESIKDFARKNGCKKLFGCTSDPKAFDLAVSVGFVECYRYVVMSI